MRFLENRSNDFKSPAENFYPEGASQDEPTDNRMIEAIDVVLTPEPIGTNHENLDEVDEGTEETDKHVEEATQTRRRGRPRIVRTGLPGRPRKDYRASQAEFDQADFACVAEISVTHRRFRCMFL